MEEPRRVRALLVVGLLLVAVGLIANDWLPTGLVSGLEDERYRERRALLAIVSALTIGLGLFLALLRRFVARSAQQLALFAVASGVGITIFVAVDIALGAWDLARLRGEEVQRGNGVSELRDRALPDPLVGWVPVPGSRHRHASDEFDVVYDTDEDGFRRLPNIGLGRRRIFVFGDSYAFGHGVASEETFAGVMRREILADDVHVFNGALAGQGLIQMVGRFLSYEASLRPGDLVIFAPISRDLRRNLDDLSFVSRLIYHQSAEGAVPHFPVYRDGHIESVSTDDPWLRRVSFFFVGRETRKLFEFAHAAIRAPDTTRHALEMIDDVQRRTRARGAGFALIFLPRERELRRGGWEEDVSQFSFISIRDAFPQGDAALSIRIGEDSHWNATGHRIAARAIVGALLDQGLLGTEDLRRGAVATTPDAPGQ